MMAIVSNGHKCKVIHASGEDTGDASKPDFYYANCLHCDWHGEGHAAGANSMDAREAASNDAEGHETDGSIPPPLGLIERGIDKLNKRKMATGTIETSQSGDKDFARLMLSGLDLDIDELDIYRREAVNATIESLERNQAEGKSFDQAFWIAIAACWVDGIQAGIHIGREQAEG